ncbi:Uncharacterized protein TCM_022381 [Theobroma cacao]|uniref:Reverse transcriptase Ty1/copia-type domain-containing protein n=1 Tax=Theobroma cacao TaxID=3641 RepID=A0A061ETB3_THECC|nr:Uncharacterized protein TCM_022381 [Theobroma cacao]
MTVELKALEDNGTWSIVPLPSNCNVIGYKWVYKVKLNADGNVERYKARLVVKGYNQIKGFDHQDTFNPVGQRNNKSDVKEFLKSEFKLKDLGKVKYILGLEITRSLEGISICQRKYALDLMEEQGLLGTKLVLSQFTEKPGIHHLAAAHRVLKYIKKAPGQGILMKSKCNLRIFGYSDSDWAGCLDTRKSVTGYCIFVGDSLVSWKSKKQSVMARNSAKAECRSMAATCCEIIWLRSLMADFGINHSETVNLYSDSQSAIQISKNHVLHEKTKHIEMDCHFIRDKVLARLINPLHISTQSQLSDIFTKALQPRQFYNLLNKMNVHDIHSSS